MRMPHLVAVALLLGLFGSGVALADPPIMIRFSHVVAEDTPKGIAANLFKQRTEAKFPGRVQVEVYPASQRFTDEEVLLALLFGDVQMAAPSFTLLEAFSPATQVFELPYLFKSVEHLHRFEDGETGQALLTSMEPRGIRGLAYWDSGMRVISADRPLPLPADAHGLTFRIEPSTVFQAQYARIGVVAIQMPFKQIPQALKRGLVNGLENSWSNLYSSGIYPLQHHFVETNHSFLGYMVVTSSAFWDGLPTDVRDGLEAILADVSLEERRIAHEKAISDRERIVATGKAEVIVPSSDQQEAWRNAFLPVWDRFIPTIGSDVVDAAVAAGEPRP